MSEARCAVDVVIENFRPSTMDRLGLQHEVLHARSLHLPIVRSEGTYNRDPRGTEAAIDSVVQASSGLLSITGTEGGYLMQVLPITSVQIEVTS